MSAYHWSKYAAPRFAARAGSPDPMPGILPGRGRFSHARESQDRMPGYRPQLGLSPSHEIYRLSAWPRGHGPHLWHGRGC